MDLSKYDGACAFAIGLAITLFLAAYLTPRQWWRRPNLRALMVMVVGTWGFGSLILHFTQGWPEATPIAAIAQAQAPASVQADSVPIAGEPFRVHRDLNLRVAAGVDTARLITVPAGATVTPTGERDGDWWRIKARVAGHDTVGWASSLWLRRSGE